MSVIVKVLQALANFFCGSLEEDQQPQQQPQQQWHPQQQQQQQAQYPPLQYQAPQHPQLQPQPQLHHKPHHTSPSPGPHSPRPDPNKANPKQQGHLQQQQWHPQQQQGHLQQQQHQQAQYPPSQYQAPQHPQLQLQPQPHHKPHHTSPSPGPHSPRPDPNQANQHDTHYTDLRKRANEEGDAMVWSFQASHEAYARGDGAGAKELSNQGKEHQRKMEQLNKQASDWIFVENNKDSKPGEIDLHGLYVKEAIAHTDNAIEQAKRKGDTEIHLIVGKGLHSPEGAKLKPAIEDLMQKHQLVAELDPHNAGVLIVHLGGGSRDREDQNQTNQHDPHYTDLRKRANEERDAMVRSFQESREAYTRGDRLRSKELSDQGKNHRLKMEQLNKQARYLIFMEKNKDCKPGEIDLHRLSVKEAIAHTDSAIEQAKRKGYSEIRLIVGKGLHSRRGIAKIKPAIIKDLMRKNELVVEDPYNTGVLIVHLSGGSRSRDCSTFES